MSMSIRTKLLILFTALYLLLFLVGGLAVQWFSVRVAEDEIRTTLLSAATGTAASIQADDAKALAALDTTQLTFDPKSPYWGIDNAAYQRLCDQLALTKKLGGKDQDPSGQPTSRLSVYSYVGTSDPKVIRYIGSASAVNNPPGGTKLGTVYTTKPKGTINYIVTGLTEAIINLESPITDSWGTWYSAFAPIKAADGTVVGAVGVDMHDTTVAATKDAITKALLGSFVIAFAILFILVVIASRLITAPLSKLAKAASHVAEGNYAAELPTQGRFPDETVQLAKAFETMVGKVAKREETLKQEVVQLRVEIDEAKKNNQVSEIVESEFFRDLQVKAQTMRNRRQQGATLDISGSNPGALPANPPGESTVPSTPVGTDAAAVPVATVAPVAPETSSNEQPNL